MPVTFNLSDKQDLEIARWEKMHSKECVLKLPFPIKGVFTFRFTPTDLGVITCVECPCGTRKDVTDYN